ncbi:MAG: hypothetical protein LBI42_04415 [Chitinispirillales bacterium]|jgi:hypothetical protein|nr:hypothetical protein [Chitinispirillales bacterium]
MDNQRYNDFLEFALKQILQSAQSYAAQAKLCEEHSKKLFLYFLSSRKREQYILLEKENAEYGNSPRGCGINPSEFKEIQFGSAALSQMDVSEINAVLCGRARQEFKFFIDLASFEEDTATKKLLIKLSRISKKSIKDIETGFSLFISQPKKHLNLPVLCREILPAAIRGERSAVFN